MGIQKPLEGSRKQPRNDRIAWVLQRCLTSGLVTEGY